MSTYRWRPQEERLLQTLLPTNSYREISEQINRRHDKEIPGFPCERTDEAVRKKCVREGWTAEACANFTKEDPHKNRWDQIREIQAQYKAQAVHRRRGLIEKGKITTKILSLSDIHFPLAAEDLIAQALNDNADAGRRSSQRRLDGGVHFQHLCQKQKHCSTG